LFKVIVKVKVKVELAFQDMVHRIHLTNRYKYNVPNCECIQQLSDYICQCSVRCAVESLSVGHTIMKTLNAETSLFRAEVAGIIRLVAVAAAAAVAMVTSGHGGRGLSWC